jgi:hypothetical protein
MSIYYALWYKSFNGEISANAISKNINSLLPLHYSSIENLDSYYHQYKTNILYINVGEIDCYLYNRENKKLELIKDDNELKNVDGQFYAINHLPFIKEEDYIQKEILVYLTKEDHEIWHKISHDNSISFSSNSFYPRFFYDENISEVVNPDTYYVEGIMNA